MGKWFLGLALGVLGCSGSGGTDGALAGGGNAGAEAGASNAGSGNAGTSSSSGAANGGAANGGAANGGAANGGAANGGASDTFTSTLITAPAQTRGYLDIQAVQRRQGQLQLQYRSELLATRAATGTAARAINSASAGTMMIAQRARIPWVPTTRRPSTTMGAPRRSPASRRRSPSTFGGDGEYLGRELDAALATRWGHRYA